MKYRLTRIHVNRRGAWLILVALGIAATVYLAWGAWESAHDPKWPYLGQAWWRAGLRPDNDRTLLAVAAVWLVALTCYWWPRKLMTAVVGLTTVVAMVAVGGVLGASSLLPCHGGQTATAVLAWVLGLYVGQPPSVYQSPACPGQPPLALQLGEIICLGATLLGAVAAAAVLWREPLGRFRSRFVREATVFTGPDALTMPLLRAARGHGAASQHRGDRTGREPSPAGGSPRHRRPRHGRRPDIGTDPAADLRGVARMRAELSICAAPRCGRE